MGVGNRKLADVMNLSKKELPMILASAILPLTNLQAETVAVPNIYESTPASGAGLSIPFSRPGSRWQQIYMQPQFNSVAGDVIEIHELRFRIDEASPIGSTFSTTVPGLNILFSTTPRTFDSATAVFAENIDRPLFEALPPTNMSFNGSHSSASSFDVVIPLPNAYQYDRRAGNLLVDIRVPSGSGLPFLDQQIGTGIEAASFSIGGLISSPVGTKTTQGLVTQFEYSVVPEPQIIGLIILGSISLLIKTRRSE